MVEAIRAVDGDAAVRRIQWERDDIVERIVGGLIPREGSRKVERLELQGVVQAYVEDDTR
jgi:hypothetical protein